MSGTVLVPQRKGADGATAVDAAEAAELPPAFVAITVKV
jgi:hypothetical protein